MSVEILCAVYPAICSRQTGHSNKYCGADDACEHQRFVDEYGDPASGVTSPDTAALGAQAPGPRNIIPFEISDRVHGTDIIPDEVLLKCPEYDPDGSCESGGTCAFNGNENACSAGATP